MDYVMYFDPARTSNLAIMACDLDGDYLFSVLNPTSIYSPSLCASVFSADWRKEQRVVF